MPNNVKACRQITAIHTLGSVIRIALQPRTESRTVVKWLESTHLQEYILRGRDFGPKLAPGGNVQLLFAIMTRTQLGSCDRRRSRTYYTRHLNKYFSTSGGRRYEEARRFFVD